jgi:hypothetical protein
VQSNRYEQTVMDKGSSTVFNTQYTNYYAFIKVCKGTTVNNITFYPMLEIGDVATEFEMGKGMQTVEVVDGIATGLTSVSPNMTLIADAGTIECEYNMDIKSYIDKKLAELVKEAK